MHLGKDATLTFSPKHALILYCSGDQFYVRALRSYIERFNFKNDPLDVALRKLLMEVGLPRETQQIDRVVEAFAGQYVLSNPNLFASEGIPLPYLYHSDDTDYADFRSPLYSSVQPDHAAHRRLQQVKQAQDDKT